MAEIHINKEDVLNIIRSYESEDESYNVRSIIGDDKKKRCTFILNRKECCIDIFFKKDTVNILPVGNNITTANVLINYIAEKGFSKAIKPIQFAFDCNVETVLDLVDYIREEQKGIIECEQFENRYRFQGYNQDTVTLNVYPSKNKVMIQGKPFITYSIITTFLSMQTKITFEDVISINNAFVGVNTPSTTIRMEMKSKLGDSYSYLDEALLKSISGSLSMLKQNMFLEDYTGFLTGEFKALEGYLKKLLSKRYGYKLKKHNTFDMFYVNENISEIDQNKLLSNVAKEQLRRIYKIYQDKRNVYLHATIDPAQTRIIQTYKEASELSEEILHVIRDSYQQISLEDGLIVRR